MQLLPHKIDSFDNVKDLVMQTYYLNVKFLYQV